MQHVVSFSGGVTSWAAAKLVQDRIMNAEESLVLLFADTLMEAPDVYEFLKEGARNLGRPVTRLCDGRTPWQVFRDERYLGNSRIDPCSKILKRQLMDRWRNQHCDKADSTHYVGLDFSEIERFETHARLLSKKGWTVRAPLIEYRFVKSRAIEWATQEGLTLPRAYASGFSHANCGGMCVKAGQHHWALLYQHHPDRYLQAEREEADIRRYLDRDVTILKDRTGGESTPLTLADFRERLDNRWTLKLVNDGGGCGCALERESTVDE